MSLWLDRLSNILPYPVRVLSQNHNTVIECFCHIPSKSTSKQKLTSFMSLWLEELLNLLSLSSSTRLVDILPYPVRLLLPGKSTSKSNFGSPMPLRLEESLNTLCFSRLEYHLKNWITKPLCCSAFLFFIISPLSTNVSVTHLPATLTSKDQRHIEYDSLSRS